MAGNVALLTLLWAVMSPTEHQALFRVESDGSYGGDSLTPTESGPDFSADVEAQLGDGSMMPEPVANLAGAFRGSVLRHPPLSLHYGRLWPCSTRPLARCSKRIWIIDHHRGILQARCHRPACLRLCESILQAHT